MKPVRLRIVQRLLIMRDAGIFFNKSEEMKYHYLVDIGGSDLINLMIEKRNNATYTHYWIQKIFKYLNKSMKEDIRIIAFWVVEYKQQYQSRKAIEADVNKKLWWSIITQGKTLQGNFFN